jgi:hypothetical protein
VRKVVLLLLAVVLLASCGGDDDEASAPTETVQATGSDYFETGNAACKAATTKLLEVAPQMSAFFETDSYPPGAVEPYGDVAAEIADVLEALAAELSALEPPSDQELMAGQVVDFLESEVADLRRVQKAAETGSELDQRVETNLFLAHADRTSIAAALGLDECGVRVLG